MIQSTDLTQMSPFYLHLCVCACADAPVNLVLYNFFTCRVICPPSLSNNEPFHHTRVSCVASYNHIHLSLIHNDIHLSLILARGASLTLANTNLFTISETLSFEKCFISGLIQYVTFGD